MPTIRTARTGRNWYGRQTHAVIIEDSTGRITFRGYSRADARGLADALTPLVGDRPVGELAHYVADVIKTLR
jgi:hypothetical protein